MVMLRKKNERDLRSLIRTKTFPTKFESELKEVLELSGWSQDLESGFSNTMLFIAGLHKLQCYYPRITDAYVFHHSGAPAHLDPTGGFGEEIGAPDNLYATTYTHSTVQPCVPPRLPRLIQACLALDSDVLEPLVSLLVSMVEEDLCRRFSLFALIIVAAHIDPKDRRISNLIVLLDEVVSNFVSVPDPARQYLLSDPPPILVTRN